MSHPLPSRTGRRGRPSKFGRPSQVVALTLPQDVIRGLTRLDADLAWAIVTLFSKRSPRERGPAREKRPDAELVNVLHKSSLIVVNRAVFKRLPGVNILPLDETHAFLALPPDKGMADLELAVHDRLEERKVGEAERDALTRLRAQLRKWRGDRALTFHTRSIIVVERVQRRRRTRSNR